MANTYAQIYLQFVFAVKYRSSLISDNVADEIHSYIGGLITNRKQKLITIGGIPDHVHLLVGVRPPFSISDFMRDVKCNSSHFINENKLTRGHFQWQDGYGVFSYGRSQLDAIAEYMRHQREHHQHRSFRSEYMDLLRLFEVDFDERYLFEWFDHDPNDPPEYALPLIGLGAH